MIVTKVWNKVVLFLFCIYMTGVTLLSFRWVSEMDFEQYTEIQNIITRSPFRTMLAVAALTAFFTGVCFMMTRSKSPEKLRNILISAVFIVRSILCIVWVSVNTYPMNADQELLWGTAVAMEKGQALTELGHLVYNPMLESVTEYLSCVPYQSGMLYIMRFVIAVTKIANPAIWRWINVFALLIADLGLILVSGEIFEKDKDAVMTVTALLNLLLVPTLLYTTYVYGTTLSMAFVIWAIYGVMKLLKTDHYAFLLLPVIMIPLANRLYSGTLVATVAVVITLVIGSFSCEKKKRMILIGTAALTIMCCALTGHISRQLLYRDTGISTDFGGIPVLANVYMGIAEEDGVTGGPGSYTAIAYQITLDYGEEAGERSKDMCLEAVKEYLEGKRSLKFFVEKTKYQWCDPYFQGLVLTCYPRWADDKVSLGFSSFVHGPVPTLMYKHWLRYFIPFIYLISLAVGGLLLLKRKMEYCNILFLYFIGGFTFQLIWESKSRYCLPYVVCLLPIAAYGIVLICKRLSGVNSIRMLWEKKSNNT